MENLEAQPVLTDYEKAEFFSRLESLVQVTDEYDGALPRAWENIQRLESPSGIGAISNEAGTLVPNHEHEINELTRKITNADLGSVVIEAAHVYLYQDIEQPSVRESILTQCLHASALTERLEGSGIGTNQLLFIDDYNPDPNTGSMQQSTTVESLVDLVNSAGYYPETIIYEGDLESMAMNMIKFMHHRQESVKVPGKFDPDMQLKDIRPEGEEDSLHLKRRNYELYRLRDNKVSCAMLDSALTILKLRYLGEGVINILPSGSDGGQGFSYKGQQRKMREILYEHLDVRKMPVFNLFTGNDPTQKIAAGAHNHFRKPRVAAA